MKDLIDRVDLEGIRAMLTKDPGLANEGIPVGDQNTQKAHPLHRLCDGVFEGRYTDDRAVEMARVFLEFGADVNGNERKENQDTPLIAATSLRADQVALLYIDHGADIHHGGCHGGTALHWAAWCGRDTVLKRLIREGAEINRLCVSFKSTPLFWAIHGHRFGGEGNRHRQMECARLLLEAGADKTIPNKDGTTILWLLNEEDREWRDLLQ